MVNPSLIMSPSKATAVNNMARHKVRKGQQPHSLTDADLIASSVGLTWQQMSHAQKAARERAFAAMFVREVREAYSPNTFGCGREDVGGQAMSPLCGEEEL